ncbi:MAG: iron-containing alcohol dehydrogenase [Thermoflexales bacterium]|nr:iron-containing alcohol dehydrogenase [Thermoflexales bacterium]MCS7324540.1 iron-containing alcohol dehydrogenase [Thermoflexales bacterium]MDW8053744.1 iron-containing alcohol dehydrogenase [Anaerolineae bacterium]MDW8293000.1 iron-containing alcohol dehydrogenase [Anaerolineae bacterium]
MWFFRSPTLVYGDDALDYLRELNIHRALIVTDANIEAAGLVQKATERLDSQAALAIFREVEAEPSLATVQRGAAALRAFDPQWIIAIGGGSVIDAAKAMWVLYENPDLDLEALAPMTPIVLRQRARLIAIPTTAGTGSEATWAFVITLPGNPPRKLGSGHPLAVPDYAIVDPNMSRSAPQQLTADSGMDAITQAIEAFFSTWANDYTDGLSLAAARLGLEHLARAVHHPDDLIAREKMANCAAIGGLAYINSMVGLAHAMGHALGAIFHVPHGRAVGLFLPYVLEFYALEPSPTIQQRFVELARFVGLAGDDADQAAKQLIARLRALARAVGQPLTIAALGISESAFYEALDALVDNTMSDTVLFGAPRQPSLAELRRLFVCAFEGTPVTV